MAVVEIACLHLMLSLILMLRVVLTATSFFPSPLQISVVFVEASLQQKPIHYVC